MRVSTTIFLLLCLAGTGKAQTPVGTWEWSHSVLLTGEIIDPGTEGYTRTLIFEPPPDREFVELRGYEVHIPGLWLISDLWWEGSVHDYLEVHTGNSVPYLEGILTFGPGGDTMVVDNFTDQHFRRPGTVPAESVSWSRIRSLYR